MYSLVFPQFLLTRLIQPCSFALFCCGHNYIPFETFLPMNSTLDMIDCQCRAHENVGIQKLPAQGSRWTKITHNLVLFILDKLKFFTKPAIITSRLYFQHHRIITLAVMRAAAEHFTQKRTNYVSLLLQGSYFTDQNISPCIPLYLRNFNLLRP